MFFSDPKTIPPKVFTVWPACQARALPIDLSGVVLNLPQSTASIIMADDVNHFEKFVALLFILKTPAHYNL